MVDTGDLKSPGREAVPVRIGPPAPKRRESEQDSLLFGGQPAAGKDPLRSIIWEGITDPLPGPPHADLIAGSDCRDEPDMKQETAVKYRFPGLFCALCTVLCRKNQRYFRDYTAGVLAFLLPVCYIYHSSTVFVIKRTTA